MSNLKEHNAITPESVLAAVKEMFAESRAKFEQELKESRAEFDRKSEQHRIELKESRAEFEQELKESREEFDRKSEKHRADFELELKQSRAEHAQRMKELEKHVGGMANTQGDFAEEFFFNSIDKSKENFFGEKYEIIERQRKRTFKNGVSGEYDIMLINGKSIGIVETKFKAQQDDIDKVLKKVETFRATFPEYKNHILYLGLAAMSFGKGVEKKTKEEGIAVIKQVGQTMVVIDNHLKAFN